MALPIYFLLRIAQEEPEEPKAKTNLIEQLIPLIFLIFACSGLVRTFGGTFIVWLLGLGLRRMV